ncbi:MAG: hypothetical protein LBE31_00225 [Deltaproteobacteria bacterium]|jgi:hypothetical protein|nr:hypothetical protein [Deltaproteobacteria bacterium]
MAKTQNNITFQDYFFKIIYLACNDIFNLKGKGVLTQDIDHMVDYFSSRYCNINDLIELNDDDTIISYNQDKQVKLFEYEDELAPEGGLKNDDTFNIKLLIPFKGYTEILSISKPIDADFTFELDTYRMENRILINRSYDISNIKGIFKDCLHCVRTMQRIVAEYNQEFVAIYTKLSDGIQNLYNHKTKIFNSVNLVIEYCYPYLAFDKKFKKYISKEFNDFVEN